MVLALVFLVVEATGCASSRQARQRLLYPQAFDQVERILVVPFENLTPFPEAGLIIADLMADELRAWQGYELRDRHTVESLARKGEVSLPMHWGRAEAVRFARRLGVDAVMFGTVVEYGYLREHRSVSELATVALTARLASAESGRVIWSGTMLGTGGSDLNPNRPPLSDVSRRTMALAFGRMFDAYNAYRNERARSDDGAGGS